MKNGSRLKRLFVIVSLDVEEEGLFYGNYPTKACSVTNVGLLRQLEPLWHELGFPLTLFCTHSVLADSNCRQVLSRLRDHCGAEIAAHLHHWSTPPYEGDCGMADGKPQRSHSMDRSLLAKRLDSLLAAASDLQSAPVVSFRMGRWDLKGDLRPLLAERGILVDSSVCPLRSFAGGADFFLAPADPYWVGDAHGRSLLELPITQVPLAPWLARAWYGLQWPQILDRFHFFAALSANPVWHSATVMRLATRLHVLRGGTVLSLFWHSSEMQAGSSPNVPDQQAAKKLFQKIWDFLVWLKANFAVRPVTASTLYGLARAGDVSFSGRPAGPGDW